MNRKYALMLAPLMVATLAGADFKAGFGRREITPPIPIWMAGFAARTQPGDSIVHDLWTKALALEDGKGERLLVITIDLVKMPRPMIDAVADRIHRRHGIERSRLLVNFSHTHSGPSFTWNRGSDREMIRRIEKYRETVVDAMTAAADEAIAGLRPARLSYGAGQVEFSHNRRERVPGGGWKFGVNPSGPVDRTVPVVRVTGTDGKLRGVLFGLSCHPSALTPQFHQICGDYSGFAQAAYEKANPGATAMFLQLCGGDQTTHPRGKMELAEKYGQDLSAEVTRVLAGPLKQVKAPIRAAMLTTELPFAPYSLEMFQQQAKENDPILRRHAERMLALYDSGQPPVSRLPYTMQAIRFGKDLTILAMNGEVVVDYALRVKREFGAEGMIVAGYSNDIPCYIPSLRVLKEGGYEARDAIMMGGLPSTLGEGVEETIFTSIRELMKAVGRPAATR
ncbi:MAG TPA: neutral/alkaline non-lysosomal ceramidase N-terminal domain-containing protein [Bryobacteraceae bacterium]|nr:neutral/alkaline non-lysosomal ceramidase N-terminal domain-containing protein [Bryobacteraceae bacterium]